MEMKACQRCLCKKKYRLKGAAILHFPEAKEIKTQVPLFLSVRILNCSIPLHKIREIQEIVNRYFIEISYNGANYSGWQIQENAISVQEILQNTARMVLRNPEIEITGSSRTDAGVHAVAQIASLDFEPGDSLENLVFKWNAALPSDIAVNRLFRVQPGVSARFDAEFRQYRYVISTRRDPFYEGRALYHYGSLDIELLQACADLIKENRNFQAFCKVKTEVKHFDCIVEMAQWKEENHLLLFEIRANRFLRGMVRGLVGTMLDVGKGKISLSAFESVLKSKDRKKAGENAAACGLYLMEVGYPPSVLF